MKISIIIPVYNTVKYIDRCLESCISQSYDDYEIILIDDGSKDGSSEKCDEWANKNKKVKAFHFENAGAATARNRGIEKSSGEYICFIDSDDCISHDYLEYLYMLCDNSNADISVCGFADVYQGNEPKQPADETDEPVVFTGPEAMENLLYQRYFISAPWGTLSKRNIWDKVRFPDGRRVEDVATVYKEYAAANKVVYGHRKLYYRYLLPDSTIYTTYTEKNREYLSHCRDIVKWLKEYYPKYEKSGYHRLFSACFQILSETDKSINNEAFLREVYNEIKKSRKTVLTDKKARIRNRGAALLSYISIDILHGSLRLYYKSKVRKIKREYGKIKR